MLSTDADTFTCSFEVSPTPRTRPPRNNDDEQGKEAGSSSIKPERVRSQSGPSATALAAHQQHMQNVRFAEQQQQQQQQPSGAAFIHQRRQSAPRYQPYPGATPQAGLPPEMAHSNPFAQSAAAGHRQSLPHPQQQQPQQQQQIQWAAPPVPVSPRQQISPLEPIVTASAAPPAAAPRPQAKRRASRNKAAGSNVPARGAASINELHNLVATMIQGEEAYSDYGSDDAGEELGQVSRLRWGFERIYAY